MTKGSVDFLITISGLTETVLAEHLGVHLSTFSRYLKILNQQNYNQKNAPPIHVVISLADYFDVSTDFILGRTNIESPENYVLTEEHLALIKKFNLLSDKDKILAIKLCNDIVRNLLEERFR